MDAPVWSNDLLYLNQMILTIIVTVALTAGCFYISRRADKRRAARLSGMTTVPAKDTSDAASTQDA